MKVNVNHNQVKLAHFCAAIGNPTRVVIMETLAAKHSCVTDEIIDISGLSKFTVGANLKSLKKSGLINGSFGIKNLYYCINYKQLEEFKSIFDEFYNKIIENKQKINPENVICSKNIK